MGRDLRMAEETHVLFHGKLPGKAALNRAMKELGFPLAITPATRSLEGHSGYLPMKLRREETRAEFDLFQGRAAGEVPACEHAGPPPLPQVSRPAPRLPTGRTRTPTPRGALRDDALCGPLMFRRGPAAAESILAHAAAPAVNLAAREPDRHRGGQLPRRRRGLQRGRPRRRSPRAAASSADSRCVLRAIW